MPTGHTDGQTDGHQTVTLRFPLDAASVKMCSYRSALVNIRKVLVRFLLTFCFDFVTFEHALNDTASVTTKPNLSQEKNSPLPGNYTGQAVKA